MKERKNESKFSCFLARDRAADSRFLIMRLFRLSPRLQSGSANLLEPKEEGGGVAKQERVEGGGCEGLCVRGSKWRWG